MTNNLMKGMCPLTTNTDITDDAYNLLEVNSKLDELIGQVNVLKEYTADAESLDRDCTPDLVRGYLRTGAFELTNHIRTLKELSCKDFEDATVLQDIDSELRCAILLGASLFLTYGVYHESQNRE